MGKKVLEGEMGIESGKIRFINMNIRFIREWEEGVRETKHK